MAELPVWGAAVSAVTLLAEFLLEGRGRGLVRKQADGTEKHGARLTLRDFFLLIV